MGFSGRQAMTFDDVAAARIIALGLAGPGAPDPLAAVQHLLCLQGQDLRGAIESVALRTAARDPSEVVAALADGRLVRSWTQRGTLHLVAGDDVGWLLDLTGERTWASMARRREQLGIDDATVARAGELAADLIGSQGPVTRQELLGTWEPLGVGDVPGRGYHLIVSLAVRQALVQGAMAPGGTSEQLFALSDDWLGERRRLAPDEALAELVGRFVAGHGPVAVADITRWSGLPATWIRQGVAAARADGAVAESESDGRILLHDPALPDLLAAHRDEALETLLLPGFDELILGYRDRTATLALRDETHIVPGGNGMFRNTVVEQGRVVGTWRRNGRAAGGGVEATPLPGRRLNQRRVARAARAYPAFTPATGAPQG